MGGGFSCAGKECGLVDFESIANSVDKGFRFNGEFSNFIDNDDFAIVNSMLNRRDGYTLEFSCIEAIPRTRNLESMLL